ncbi:MAG TPA: SDR family oxidoreductase [Acidimicrobiales bacterium]|nr:SDR family oxidoreductase [Acidimicrobiales bacterium]
MTGADQPLGRGLATALGRAGADVGLLAGNLDEVGGAAAAVEDTGARVERLAVAFGGRAELEAVFVEASTLLGPIDIVVHTAVDPVALEPLLLADVDDDRWEAVWEGTMRSSLLCCQVAFTHMAGRGGRIIFSTPTVSMSGAAGLVAYTAAVEGQRLLAKSAARQWGSQGITVNCVAPAPAAGDVDDKGGRSHLPLTPPALGGPGDPETDLGPIVVFLASDAGHFVTGATISLDGGVWMAP